MRCSFDERKRWYENVYDKRFHGKCYKFFNFIRFQRVKHSCKVLPLFTFFLSFFHSIQRCFYEQIKTIMYDVLYSKAVPVGALHVNSHDV